MHLRKDVANNTPAAERQNRAEVSMTGYSAERVSCLSVRVVWLLGTKNTAEKDSKAGSCYKKRGRI